MSFDFITIGDSVVDLMISVTRFPKKNEDTVAGEGIIRQLGGVSNILIQASRLGLKTGLIDLVGSDENGMFFINGLKSERVDVSRIEIRKDHRTAYCICMVDRKGEHAYIGFPGATKFLTPDRIKEPYIQDSKLLYISGYTLVNSPLREAVIKAIQIALKTKKHIIFDPSPLVHRIDNNFIEKVIKASEIIILNQRELETITSGKDFKEGAKQLIEKGPRKVVIKLGKDGCFVTDKSINKLVPGHQVKVVDSTGAGDAFNAAFIFGYLKCWPIEDIAKFSNAVGALKVTKFGAGLNLPTRNEIKKFISEFLNMDFVYKID